MPTITDIVTKVVTRFPRMDTVAEGQITTDIYSWLKEVCSEYPFWFLRIDPGNVLPSNFPFEDISDIALETHYKTDWLDRGWLHAREGQEKYFLAAPAAVGQYDTDATKWYNCAAQKINYVKEFGPRGTQYSDLEVQFSGGALARVNWNSHSRPTRVFFETGQDGTGASVSWLRFNPIPEKDYLYAVSFTLDKPLNYGSPITNRFFQEYPECAVYLGMMFAADYFNEAQAYAFYHTKVYGYAPGGVQATPHIPRRAGYIEKMKRDTQRKTEQQDQTVPVYKGAGWAVGRAGGNVRSPRGTYYGKDGFS